MSAWLHGVDHIDLLVTWAQRLDLTVYAPTSPAWDAKDVSWQLMGKDHVRVAMRPTEVGAALIAEEIASVSYRYPEDTIAGLPGPIDKTPLLDYRFRPTGLHLTPVQIMVAVQSFEYQSCEHPEWEGSFAYDFCEALTSRLISELPGYADAGTWDYERQEVSA